MQAPAALLAGKYKFKSSLQAGSKALAWLAEDVGSSEPVIISALAGARVAALKKVVNVQHGNLATLSDIVETPPPDQVPGGKKVAAVVVARYYRGETLHQRLKRGPLEPALAVDWFVRVGGAIAAIHAAGGAHGAISPRSIIVNPEGSNPGPILTQLVSPSSGAYCAPERLQGLGPSEADDVWALHAAFFTALSCTPPYRGEDKNELLLSIAGGRMQRLEALGVSDPALSELVEKGLTADLKRRRAKVADFVAELEAWSPPQHNDWEDDEATLVASAKDFTKLAAAVGSGKKPEPVASIPPVALEDDDRVMMSEAPAADPVAATPAAPPATAGGAESPGEEPLGYDDDDDATAIMSKPPSDVAALLRGAAASPSVDPPPITTPVALPAEATIPENAAPTLPLNAEPTLPLNPMPVPDAATTAPAPAPTESAPAGAIPPDLAPPPPPFAAASAAEPAPGIGTGSSAPAPAAFPTSDSAYPPSISAYPPTTSLGPSVPQLQFDDDDDIKVRSAARGPVIVILVILVVAALGIAIALYMNNSASRAGKLRSEIMPTPSAKPAASPAATPVAKDRAQVASRAAVDVVSGRAPAKKSPAKVQDRGACVAGHFEAGTLSGKEDFDFLCKAEDFRGINSQLHRRLVVAGAGKVTPGMREWSTFAWFELAATAVIRSACCPEGTPHVDLPQTADGCPQLSAVLRDVAKLPVSAGQPETRAKAFEEAVVCLFAKGIPRPYNYSTRPTGHARIQFQTFLTRAVQS